MNMLRTALIAAILLLPFSAQALDLEQVVSREHPHFDCADSMLVVGQDGKLYFPRSYKPGGYLIRMNPDGSERIGTPIHYSNHGIAANAEGYFVVAETHFAHSAAVYDANFKRIGAVTDFDNRNYDSPGHVEAGSVNFYALDHQVSRIVEISPAAKIVRTYSIAKFDHNLVDFRVAEDSRQFYVWPYAEGIRCVGFDGKLQFAPPTGRVGGWDVSSDGTLYVIDPYGTTVNRFSATGERLEPIALNMPEQCRPAPGQPGFNHLRVSNNELFLKRPSSTELCQRYDVKTGNLLNVISIDYEKLAVTLAGDILTAGEATPIIIRFDPSGRSIKPLWRVWLRPFNTARFKEMTVANAEISEENGVQSMVGEITPPADGAGLYQLKVTPGVDGADSEYVVQTLVEIRSPGAKGSATVLTPVNRIFFARGEEIPVSVVLRTQDAANLPENVILQLVQDQTVIARDSAKATLDKPVAFTLSKALTSALEPGEYQLQVQADGMTDVGQKLVIGPGIQTDRRYFYIQHGDYGNTYPLGNVWNAADNVAEHVNRVSKLGCNLFLDRVGKFGGHGNGHLMYWQNNANELGFVRQLEQRLKDDPLAPAPQRAQLATSFQQMMSAYSAEGISEMAILATMDAGLPLGTGYDGRTREQFAADIKKATEYLQPYPSYRGWSWTANWWVGKFGERAAKDDAERTAYHEAVKKAQETGEWSPVIDTVSDRWMLLAVDAQKFFNETLDQIDPDSVTATSGAYRNVSVYPPVTFSNVDEVDLHYQAEQIQPPNTLSHNVDFQKRPGKKAWGHPELFSESGTGGMALPNLFMMIMRGADGVGTSGGIPRWGRIAEDARSGYYGIPSVFRSVGELLNEYGPWLSTLQKNDRVAIVASDRMFRIDTWSGIGGRHFTRIFEAYQSCLYAHQPASIVFLDDVQPGDLAKYNALLLIDEQVEPEPKLAAELDRAQKAGVKIFYDTSCRAGLFDEYTPLGISFTKVDSDPHVWQDDSAYWRFAGYFRDHAKALAPILDAAAEPVAVVDNPDILMSERTAGEGRYLFVVNNTLPTEMNPGELWRMTMAITTRVPMQLPVKLNANGQAVYDMFALKQVEPQAGVVQADLRHLPMRVFAILPRPVGGVSVTGPARVTAGSPFTVNASVVADNGQALNASIPVAMKFYGPDGSLLDQFRTAADATGVQATFTAPVNAVGGTYSVEVAELISGQTSGRKIEVAQRQMPVQLAATLNETANDQAEAGAVRHRAAAIESKFGPHLRDMVVTADGTLAVINAFNWDNNLYGVDLKTGTVRWRQRAGNYFTFAPMAIDNGFAVQGFDFTSAEGYHLYMGDSSGDLEKRFALYGLPKRPTMWFVPSMLSDHINNFAVPASGKWIATSGDLGLAVWSRDGKLQWSQDWYGKDRHCETLVAQNDSVLVTANGMLASGYQVSDGKQLWHIDLASTGEIVDGKASKDGSTVALRASTNGGRVFIIRNGKLAATLQTPNEDVAISEDGSIFAVTTGKTLKWYSLKNGLQWTLAGDDVLHFPRLDAAADRVAVCSELGTAYVISSQGIKMMQQDMNALAVPAWLPDGGLVLANWMGSVERLDAQFNQVWQTRLKTDVQDMRGRMLAKDTTPTVRMTNWSNASEENAAVAPNLLKESDATISFYLDKRPVEWQHEPAQFVDGDKAAPETPWVRWSDIQMIDSGWCGAASIVIDTWRTQLRVTGITFVEDPRHPESWLRDVNLEYWDAANEKWIAAGSFLSDSPVHTHTLKTPIEAARFRFVASSSPGTWPVGNVRLGELVFHGEVLSSSHPDAAAKRPVAVLFDENEDDMRHMFYPNNGFSFKFEGAYSGGRCIEIKAGKIAGPSYDRNFGETLPGWDFSIAENPVSGEYRYLQFGCKAEGADGALFGVSTAASGIMCFTLGDIKSNRGSVKVLADVAPDQWKVYRVDLWQMFGKPVKVRGMWVGAAGAPACFDKILLGRTENDLPPIQ